jgi:hypothetical protein
MPLLPNAHHPNNIQAYCASHTLQFLDVTHLRILSRQISPILGSCGVAPQSTKVLTFPANPEMCFLLELLMQIIYKEKPLYIPWISGIPAEDLIYERTRFSWMERRERLRDDVI